jgi:hypothetical protein
MSLLLIGGKPTVAAGPARLGYPDGIMGMIARAALTVQPPAGS